MFHSSTNFVIFPTRKLGNFGIFNKKSVVSTNFSKFLENLAIFNVKKILKKKKKKTDLDLNWISFVGNLMGHFCMLDILGWEKVRLEMKGMNE